MQFTVPNDIPSISSLSSALLPCFTFPFRAPPHLRFCPSVAVLPSLTLFCHACAHSDFCCWQRQTEAFLSIGAKIKDETEELKSLIFWQCCDCTPNLFLLKHQILPTQISQPSFQKEFHEGKKPNMKLHFMHVVVNPVP